MGQFKPIRQIRVSEEVLSQLKESILLGKFKSGEKLPSERELTEEFQVSRGVIREAIRALELPVLSNCVKVLPEVLLL